METSKKHLRDTALKLFAEIGFSNVSVREISNIAGMSNAMMNYYFGTKEALLNDILAELFHKAKDFVESLEKSDELVMEKIRRLAQLLVEGIICQSVSRRCTFSGRGKSRYQSGGKG